MPTFTVFKGSSTGPVQSQSTLPDELQPHQIQIRVTHSGLCGTDLHYRHADGMGLGHEGVGVVEKVGSGVTLFQVGDRAGWGYNHGSCGHCAECLSGHDIYCAERKIYGFADLDQGSIGETAIWNENFCFQIPDEISSEDAAPLQCGGVTVFAPLSEDPVKAGERVGIVGVGGLGHLAIQFAARMGAEVVVFSGTDSKKAEALKLGAKEFVATKGRTDFNDVRKVNRLLVTSNAQVDWNLFQSVMASRGVIHVLSVDQNDLKMPYMPIIFNGLRLQGSAVGSRQTHKDMLQFAAKQGIKPIIMKFPLNNKGVEEGFRTLEEGNMRYRGVFVVG